MLQPLGNICCVAFLWRKPDCGVCVMAPRANWKGYLKLSLVSCAVNLYPASSSSSRVSFNTINRKTGNKVKRQFVDAETGEVVEPEDQAKGHPISKTAYLLIDDEELDAIQIEAVGSRLEAFS